MGSVRTYKTPSLRAGVAPGYSSSAAAVALESARKS